MCSVTERKNFLQIFRITDQENSEARTARLGQADMRLASLTIPHFDTPAAMPHYDAMALALRMTLLSSVP